MRARTYTSLGPVMRTSGARRALAAPLPWIPALGGFQLLGGERWGHIPVGGFRRVTSLGLGSSLSPGRCNNITYACESRQHGLQKGRSGCTECGQAPEAWAPRHCSALSHLETRLGGVSRSQYLWGPAVHEVLCRPPLSPCSSLLPTEVLNKQVLSACCVQSV